MFAPSEGVRTGSSVTWISMIRRSKASIRHLCLKSENCAIGTLYCLMAILSGMPELETLGIINQFMERGDPFGGEMSYSIDSSALRRNT
ncbi:hypothetical protein NEOLEDRAFT_1141155 [Neolentinus lepideus HHB14362 ss-1]|uniref:Uncharacterized protein n=1 Tax=Neolentinus lepideus HHB14362 ss-1 TaxID=1314782 RepID=A0A165NT60_9AGAM|nr:hypothetical protein NEOLEDRAFT_1141155 [Neolentinus lepideus HHB14362 ss-1]